MATCFAPLHVVGGLLFGAYLSFTFLLAWTNFTPILNIVKAFIDGFHRYCQGNL